jgi:septal ring factor EnvC (AmiA/AmiB activator)
MDIFNFILNNGPLCVLAFFGFLAFYKGIPFLIKHNDERHIKAEKKLAEIDSKLQGHVIQSKNDKDNLKKDVQEIEKDVDTIQKSIKEIEEHQHKQKGTMAAIEAVILKNWKPKDDE